MRMLALASLLAAAGCAAPSAPGDAVTDARAETVQRLFTQGCYNADFDEARSRAVFRAAGLEERRIPNAAIFTSEDGGVLAQLSRFSQPGGNGQQCSVGALGIDIRRVNGLAIAIVEADGGPEGTNRERRARDGIAILGFGGDGDAVAITTARAPRARGGEDFVAIEFTRVTQ